MRDLERFLHTKLPDLLVVPEKDRGITGNFEVKLEDGTVIHSKRHAGQGKAERMEEKVAILEQIQESIED